MVATSQMAISNFHWFDFFLKSFQVVAVAGALVACISDYFRGVWDATEVGKAPTNTVNRQSLWSANTYAQICNPDPYHTNSSTEKYFPYERVSDCDVAVLRILRAFALIAVFSSSIALATSSFGENFPKAFLVNSFSNLVTLGSALTVICVYVIYVNPNRGSLDITYCESWELYWANQLNSTLTALSCTSSFGFYANFFTAAFSATAFVMAMIGNPKKTTGISAAIRSLCRSGSVSNPYEPKWGFRTTAFWVKLLRFVEFSCILVACFGDWSKLRLEWYVYQQPESFLVGLWSGVLCEK